MESCKNFYLVLAKTCPYAHRIEIATFLKNSLSVKIYWCDPIFKFSGWNLDYTYQGSENLAKKLDVHNLEELYKLNNKNFSGRSTIPILAESQTNNIISNDSSEIIKILNPELVPDNLKQDIDSFCESFNTNIVVATYKAGHAKSTEEYEIYCDLVFEYLDKLDDNLSFDTKYIFGDIITLADVHAFAHLSRFDLVFYDLFSINRKKLSSYKNINRYMNNLFEIDAFSKSIDKVEITKAKLCENNLPNYLFKSL